MSKFIGDTQILRGFALRLDGVSQTDAISHCMKTRWAYTRAFFDITPLNPSATNSTLKTTEVVSMHLRININVNNQSGSHVVKINRSHINIQATVLTDGTIMYKEIPFTLSDFYVENSSNVCLIFIHATIRCPFTTHSDP
jgi:hypothetical protein